MDIWYFLYVLSSWRGPSCPLKCLFLTRSILKERFANFLGAADAEETRRPRRTILNSDNGDIGDFRSIYDKTTPGGVTETTKTER